MSLPLPSTFRANPAFPLQHALVASTPTEHVLDIGNWTGTRYEFLAAPHGGLLERHRDQVIRQLGRLNQYAARLGIDVQARATQDLATALFVATQDAEETTTERRNELLEKAFAEPFELAELNGAIDGELKRGSYMEPPAHLKDRFTAKRFERAEHLKNRRGYKECAECGAFCLPSEMIKDQFCSLQCFGAKS